MRPAMCVVVGALCAAVLGGCANESAERDATNVAEDFLRAVRDGDVPAACALLAPRTQQDLVISDGQPCDEALPADRLGGGAVRAVTVWSDEAQVSTDGGVLFLSKFDTGWLIVAAGCQRQDAEQYLCVVS